MRRSMICISPEVVGCTSGTFYIRIKAAQISIVKIKYYYILIYINADTINYLFIFCKTKVVDCALILEGHSLFQVINIETCDINMANWGRCPSCFTIFIHVELK